MKPNIKQGIDRGDLVKGYYRLSKASNADDRDIAESVVLFGVYNEQGDTAGEMSVRWVDI